MTDNTKPEALDLADWLEAVGGGPSAKRCAALLREQHARITELESQLAQRFDAADMATAAAQGFRDGVASVSAGSEPVEWAIFAEGGNIRLWSKKPLLHPSAQPLYTHPAPTLTPGAAIAAGAVGVPRDELPECVIQLQEMWDTLEKKGKATSADLIRWSNALSSVERALAQPAASHGQAPAPTHEQIAAYLESTGAYVTNDATREAAIAEAIDTDRAKRGQAPDLHPKTSDLVQRFAAALAEKLSAAEKKYGYSDGWASPNWMDECRQHLSAHIAKGDPRDVAAYCAFLWHHGATTASPQAEQQAPTGSEIYVCARKCYNCGHAGINDDHADNAACKSCDWSGPSPEKDHCPDCEKDGTMTAACPMCSCAYIMVADTQVAAPAALNAPQAADMATAAASGFRDGVASVTRELPSWDEVFDCAVAAYCRSSASHDALRLCFQSRSQQHQITCGWTANDLMGFARGVAALYAPPTSAEGVEHG